MKMFVCPRDWTFATERFTPDHMVSLQNPGADVSSLRPPWVPPENHHVAYFFDNDLMGDPEAPTEQDIKSLIEWLEPRCNEGILPKYADHSKFDRRDARGPNPAKAWSAQKTADRVEQTRAMEKDFPMTYVRAAEQAPVSGAFKSFPRESCWNH